MRTLKKSFQRNVGGGGICEIDLDLMKFWFLLLHEGLVRDKISARLLVLLTV